VGAHIASFGHHVVGCDFSISSLLHGRKLFPDIAFIAGDLLRLPFSGGSFGGVVAFYTLIFGDDAHLARCLGEILRVLRPGGRLLAAVHGEDGSGHFDTYEGREIDFTIFGRSPDTLASATHEAGLNVLSLESRDPYDFEHQTQRIYLLARKAAPRST